MKKFLALALILTLALALSISVSAVRVVGKTDQNPQYDNGVPAIDPNVNNQTTVDIKVSAGNYESRYAVDVEYGDLSFVITGANMVWDVEALQYVAVKGDTFQAPTFKEVYVYNRSDKTVDLALNVNKDNLTGSPMTLDVVSDKTTIEAATAKNGATEGTPGKATIKVTPGTTSDWNAVANYFAPYLNADKEYTVATVTLTITATPVAP